tara:strand:+ start:73 stop:246 length:174 start_codon:yes stop_codon:yes gene_type:complete
MKTQFTDSEVEVMYRIMRDYMAEAEIIYYGNIDSKVRNLFTRLTLIKEVENAKRSKR